MGRIGPQLASILTQSAISNAVGPIPSVLFTKLTRHLFEQSSLVARQTLDTML